MTIDFGYAKSPALRLATIAWTGPWSDKKVQTQFERVEKWVQRQGLKPGRYVFREPNERRFEVGVEVRGPVRSSAGIRVRTLPAARVAHVVFDPEAIAPRVIYHGLYDWLRWQRREKAIRAAGDYREVYTANPWRDARAWARTEIQVVVRP